MQQVQACRKSVLVIAGVLAAFVAGLFVQDSWAQRWRGGGGSYYRPSYTQMQPRTMPVRPAMPSQFSGNRSFGSQQRVSQVRQYPPSIRQNAPITRVNSFTGRVSTGGSPILNNRAGKSWAVPQQATFSTRMSLMSGVSRPALVARMGARQTGALKEQFNAVASGNDLRSRLIAAKVGNGPIWSANSKMSGVRNAYDHFARHGKDFGSVNAVAYVKSAQSFVSKPPPGTLTKVRPNGDLVRYHPPTKTFAVSSSNGAVRTFYKVNEAEKGNGVEYFNKQ